MTKKFYVVPHTHWDREWYQPFQVFRARLVDVVDDLLDIMDKDDRFGHFLLDGHTAAALDYLEIRPENRGRLQALIQSGRISTGPFHILMDEFLVSGETIVRNLAKGMQTAQNLGGCSKVAYLPDMFGHISQMPQILAKAGILDAAVWRGVPRAIEDTVFRWESPDGTWVRTAYMATSYSNGTYLPADPGALKARLEHLAGELDSFHPDGKYLIMNGTDHAPPQPELPDALEGAAKLFGESARFAICSLSDYFSDLPTEPTKAWQGEFRSGARVNLLMGVVSNRVDLRRLAAETEDTLTRYSEPIAALYAPEVSRRYFDIAWDLLIQNSAHDSICACSIDDVTDEVRSRMLQVHQIAHATLQKGLEILAHQAIAGESDPGMTSYGEDVSSTSPRGKSPAAASSPYPGVLFFNPSSTPRHEVAEVTIPLYRESEEMSLIDEDGSGRPIQLVNTTDPEILLEQTAPAAFIRSYVMALSSREVMGYFINDIVVDPDASPRQITVVADHVAVGDLDIDEGKKQLLEFLEKYANEPVKIVARRPSEARLLVSTPEIPALGWGIFPIVAGPASPSEPNSRVQARGQSMENEYLRVELGSDGCYTLTHKESGVTFEGLGRLVDGGEWGDTYNYSPPPQDTLVSEPSSATIARAYEGPLGAGFRVKRRYSIPSHVDASTGARAKDRTVDFDVEEVLELRAGEPFLRVAIHFENNALDHRLRMHFPLPFQPKGSFGAGAYDVVPRGLEAEGGVHEFGLPTFPARGFVDAWGHLDPSDPSDSNKVGLAVLVGSVTEYEIVDQELAITLLRATGMLSRPDSKLRPAGAGPSIPTKASQCLGIHRVKLGVMPHLGGWFEAGVHQASERFVYPLATKETAAIPGGTTGARFDIEADNCLVSAVVPDTDRPLLRVWSPHTSGVLRVSASAREVAITGDPLPEHFGEHSWEPKEEIALGPYEIRSLRLML